MPVKMAPHQLDFWRELMAPFAPEELSDAPGRGGRKFTYVDKRALANRLDSICGPNGWFPEYEATQRGYKCRLWILCPGFKLEDPWIWHYKEDGAGFEEMGSLNKETGEFEYDVDNDEKSGYTNAFRRAGCDAWGFGRYLYGKGIPTFLDPDAQSPAKAPAAPAKPATTQAPSKPAAPAASTQKPAQGQGQGQKYDNFKIPPKGKPVFAWGKEMEKVFETTLVNGMAAEGETRGWGKMFADWDQDQVNAVCMTAIKFIATLPTYKGQFDHLLTDGQAPSNAKPPGHGTNIADLRKELSTKVQALLHKQLGRAAEPAELKEAFQNISACAINSAGSAGEVCESLARCTDIPWIANMITFVDQQIAEAAQSGTSEDIPF